MLSSFSRLRERQRKDMNSGHDAVLLDNTTEPFRRRFWFGWCMGGGIYTKDYRKVRFTSKFSEISLFRLDLRKDFFFYIFKDKGFLVCVNSNCIF